MPIHLTRDLNKLKQALLGVGALVEEAINRSLRALKERRPELARLVMEGDAIIDQREVEVEEECLKILALHQPVANDLRFIITALKVNNDLERMGDLAVNIAERTAYLATHEPLTLEVDVTEMADAVREMARMALNALIEQDVQLAREVLERDDAVDDMNRQMFKVLQARMAAEPATMERGLHLLSVSRYLERIADLATNIAEDIVFLVEGELIRHQPRPAADSDS